MSPENSNEASGPENSNEASGNEASDFDRVGGAAGLKAIIDPFVDRCFDDLMIGFFFRKANRDRVKAKEWEHAAVHLGAEGVQYTGRPIRKAHAPHRIMGGQFRRRLVILKQVMDEHQVPEDIQARWMEAQERARADITADAGSECSGRASTIYEP